MKKRLIIVLASLGLVASGISSAFALKAPKTGEVKADATEVVVTKVSNQNIAGGWGLGIAVEFSPTLSCAYWKPISGGDKVHLYNPSGSEVAASIEEVGQQLCINRNGGVNYHGYKLVFDKGWEFTDSNSNAYVLTETSKFKCELADGTTGQYWVVDEEQSDTPDPSAIHVELSRVANQNIAGGWGLGIAVEFSPTLSCAYWKPISGGDKVHLYNPSGSEVAASIEEVGQQLCINRNGGVNYKGYTLVFEAGWQFKDSQNNIYYLDTTAKFGCQIADGTVGQFWVGMDEFAAYNYAETFNTAIGAVCKNDGTTVEADLKSAWANQATAYKALKDAEKAYLVNASVSGTTALNLFAAKYESVYALRGADWELENFVGRTISLERITNQTVVETNSTTLFAVVTIVSLVSVSALGVLIVIKRRKHAK